MQKKLTKKIVEDLLKVKPDGNLYHRESQFLEFKESFNFAAMPDYFRDFSAFANNKGGYLIFGVKDRPKRELLGLAEKSASQFDKIDAERISGFLAENFNGHIQWSHDLFQISGLSFGVFYICEAEVKPIIARKNEGKDEILKNGDIYFRYGGRTQKIQYSELEAIINSRINQNNLSWLDLVQKIGKAGPQNAAILDTEKGLIEKNNSQILVVDEKLIKGVQWIREGDFSEVKGTRTLKLVGSVQPIEKVEVIRKVKEEKLKEYPLTYKDMVAEIKVRMPDINMNEIVRLIKDNGLKDDPEYSSYVFRNLKQETEYLKNGVLAKGISSIYKPSIVDYLVRVAEGLK